MAVPMTNIAGLEISRLICGSNPFLGYSYRSNAHSDWQKRHFTPERIADVLEKCLQVGITGLLANYEEARVIPRALEELERRCGRRPTWIAYVGTKVDSLKSVINDGADACYIQCGVADRCFTYNSSGQVMLEAGDTLDELGKFVEIIHEHRLPAGMGSHRWSILKLIHERDYGVDFMVTTLNYLDVHCEGYAGAVKTINQIDKPIIIIKTLGGSAKISPRDGLTCAFTGIKPGDVVAVGMEHEEAAAENARSAQDIIGYLKR